MAGNKKRRRNSQVFNFEQTEETLLENEAVTNLYKNKNYCAPAPVDLETIVEETCGSKEKGRSRREEQRVAGDGGLMLGQNKGRRVLDMEYKFWKQEDKERNRRRKNMTNRLWKGRRKPKLVALTGADEVKLLELIEQREDSSDDDTIEDNSAASHVDDDEPGLADVACVWPAGRAPRVSSSDEGGQECVWVRVSPGNADSGTVTSRSSHTAPCFAPRSLPSSETALQPSVLPLSSEGSLGHKENHAGIPKRGRRKREKKKKPLKKTSSSIQDINSEGGRHHLQELLVELSETSQCGERLGTSPFEEDAHEQVVQLPTEPRDEALATSQAVKELQTTPPRKDLLTLSLPEEEDSFPPLSVTEVPDMSQRTENVPMIYQPRAEVLVSSQPKEVLLTSQPNDDVSLMSQPREDVLMTTSLVSLVPAEELAALLETDELLFCGPNQAKGRPSKVQTSRESGRRSVRRSARIQGLGSTTGSVFLDQEGKGGTGDKTGLQEPVTKEAPTPEKKKTHDLVPAVNSASHFNKSPVPQQPETARVPEVSVLADLDKSATETLFMNNVAPLKVSCRSKNRLKTCQEEKVLKDIRNEDRVLMDLSNLSVQPHNKTPLALVLDAVPTLLLNGELQKLSLCEDEETQERQGRVTRRRSSILGSNTREVDISFPPAARRSLTGSEVPRNTLSPGQSGAGKKSFLSDSEEELFISGIFGKKTLKPHRSSSKKLQKKMPYQFRM